MYQSVVAMALVSAMKGTPNLKDTVLAVSVHKNLQILDTTK